MLPIDTAVKQEIAMELLGLTGADRAERVRHYAQFLGISEQAISTMARRFGDPARPPRADRGRSALTRDQAMLVAAVVKVSRRVDGRIPMPQKEAARLLAQTGQLETDVTYSTLCRELRRHAISKADQRRAKPHRPRAVAHPNAEWQLDFTACHQWYRDEGGELREREVATALHKNKPKEFRKIRRHYWQVTITDRYSGATFFQFRYLEGETAEAGLECLIHAMQPKPHQAFTFHGIPDSILTDNGPFAKSQMVKTFCRAFGIALKTHLPGNPRAKGGVESTHNITEQFNARLKLHPPRSDEEFNRYAFEFCVELNCLRPFRLKDDPRGLTRMQHWSAITPEQLFLPPPVEVCRAIMRTGAQPRTVETSGRLRYERRVYHVPDTDAWGREVEVCYNPRAYPEVEVTWRDPEDHHVRAVWSLQPLEMVGGFLSDSARPGEIRRPAATATQRAEGEMERIAEERWGLTHTGHSDKRTAVAATGGTHRVEWFGKDAEPADKLATRTATATPREPINPAAERRLTVVELLQAVRSALGRPLTASENTQIRTGWPEGCRQAEVEAVLDTLTRPMATLSQRERDGVRGKEDDDGDRARATGVA